MAPGSLKRDYNSPKILYRYTSQGHDILSSLKVAIYDLYLRCHIRARNPFYFQLLSSLRRTDQKSKNELHRQLRMPFENRVFD